MTATEIAVLTAAANAIVTIEPKKHLRMTISSNLGVLARVLSRR